MRWVWRLLGVAVGLAVLVVAALALVPTDRVAGLAAKEFGKATGRALTVAGPVRPTLWPDLGVRIGGIAVADADWAGPDPMLEAAALSVGLDTAALLRGDIRITGIDVERPVLRLTRAADGRANWDFAGPPAVQGDDPAPGPAAAPPAISLDRLRIDDGRVIFRDGVTGEAMDFAALTLETAVPALDRPVTVTLSATLNGAALAGRVDLAAPSDLLAGRPVTLSADLGLAGAALRIDGRAGGTPLTAEAQVALTAPGLDGPFAALGLPPPGLPAGLGRDRIALDAALTWDGAVLYLRDLAASLDGSRITGAVDLATAGPRPRITADLALDGLALAAGATPGGGPPPDPASGPAGWSTAPIDASALGLLDAAVALRLGEVRAGDLRLGPVRLLARLDDRRAVVDIAELGVAGGGVTGQAVVNGRGGLSASADLTASGIALQPLLAAMAGTDRLIAPADGRVRLLASGGSVDALVRSLSGEGRLALGQGELRGLDLAGMVRNLDPGFVGEGQKTIFDSVTASFTVAGGVLANDDLVFSAPLLRGEGAGRVDLGARSLDYRIVPTALPGADGTGGVRVPVLVTGPWGAPRVALDLEGLAAERLRLEEDKVRAAAEAALRARAAEAGIVPADGQSLQDAARDKLEDRAEDVLKREGDKLLRGLFGGN